MQTITPELACLSEYIILFYRFLITLVNIAVANIGVDSFIHEDIMTAVAE
jgi:hypothetical protein